jgi:hypothetical protein
MEKVKQEFVCSGLGPIKGGHEGLDRGIEGHQRMDRGWLSLGHINEQGHMQDDSDEDGVD